MMIKKYLLCLMLLISGLVCAQPQPFMQQTNFFKDYDVSLLWLNSTVMGLGEESEPQLRPEFIGYLGDTYQRFYIHFISVIKDPTSSQRYFVYGKSKVKNNITDFQGIITLKQVNWLKADESTVSLPIKQGQLTGEYLFYEDNKQKGSGTFHGTFISNFFIDQKNILHYDATSIFSDGYQNNQFSGSWKSYKTLAEKVCNWGDFRIPHRGDLDIGVAEFSPNEKYYMNGWQSYAQQFTDSSAGKKAKLLENAKWWQ